MERIRPYLRRAGLTEAGAVSFASCLPLLECRAKLRLPEQAASVILCALPYYTGEWEGRNISRYAIVPDYHKVAIQLLTPVCEELARDFGAKFEPFCDNSPIREVDAAARAGLGIIGEHSLLIHPKYGSWIFLCEIVTDMVLDYTEQPVQHCISCGRCRAACPGQAISGGGVDILHCLSDITQKKKALTPEETALVKKGGLLWGCDRCQEVCPYNRRPEKTPIAAFWEDIFPVLRLEDITKEVKVRAFGFRGPKPLLRNYGLLYEEGPAAD